VKNQTAFGRRQQRSAFLKPSVPDLAEAVPQGAPARDHRPVSMDEELREWKAARGVRIPWRPLLLIASLSFGMAAFVLPASTSDPVQWTLGVLSAASFLAGLTKRAAKRVTA
jgi:Flp pilus assembly protein TadB